MPTKTLQVPVIVGNGSKQVLVVTELTIAPPSPPIFRIKDIDKKVVITNKKVIPNKVIINGYLDKNINYKTLEHVHDGAVNGPLYHYTTQIPFSTFIDIIAVEGEEVKEGDNCEILDAIIEGEKDELLDPCGTTPVTYKKVLEKVVIKLVVKVTRIEHVDVEVDC